MKNLNLGRSSLLAIILAMGIVSQSCKEESPTEKFIAPEYKTSRVDFENAIRSEESVSFGGAYSAKASLTSVDQSSTFKIYIDLSKQKPLNDQQMDSLYQQTIEASKEHLLNLEDHDILKISVEFNNGEFVKEKEFEVASLLQDY